MVSVDRVRSHPDNSSIAYLCFAYICVLVSTICCSQLKVCHYGDLWVNKQPVRENVALHEIVSALFIIVLETLLLPIP